MGSPAVHTDGAKRMTTDNSSGVIPITSGQPSGVTRIAGQITVRGDLVTENRKELKQEAYDAIAEKHTDLRIRFEQSKYIDASGVGALVTLARYARLNNAVITLAGISTEQREALEAVGVANLFAFEGA